MALSLPRALQGGLQYDGREGMKTSFAVTSITVASGLLGISHNIAAQDLVIADVRIVAGNGTVMNRDGIIIHGEGVSPQLPPAAPAVLACRRSMRAA